MRPEDELVTALEIETALNHLGWSVQAFIDMVDRMEKPSPPPTLEPPKEISLDKKK
jgi:hypothetical protein